MVAGRAQTLDAVSDATSQLRSSGRSDLFHVYLLPTTTKYSLIIPRVIRYIVLNHIYVNAITLFSI